MVIFYVLIICISTGSLDASMTALAGIKMLNGTDCCVGGLACKKNNLGLAASQQIRYFQCTDRASPQSPERGFYRLYCAVRDIADGLRNTDHTLTKLLMS